MTLPMHSVILIPVFLLRVEHVYILQFSLKFYICIVCRQTHHNLPINHQIKINSAVSATAQRVTKWVTSTLTHETQTLFGI